MKEAVKTGTPPFGTSDPVFSGKPPEFVERVFGAFPPACLVLAHVCGRAKRGRLDGYWFMAEFRWFGHSCFRIRAREGVVLTDPVGRNTGYALPKQTADIVTLSHDHPGHANLDAVKPEYQLVKGPGEYELHEVFITGIRTYHDEKNGQDLGYHTVYLIELEGLVVCHLGDLGHPLSSEQAEAMAGADVLMVAAGGGAVLDPIRSAELIGQLEPKIVIPMQFATPVGDKALGGLDVLCKQLGIEQPAPEEKLVLRGKSDVGETMRMVVLTPESEAVRR
jgi:hypothetical protein